MFPESGAGEGVFKARSQNFEKRLSSASSVSVPLSVLSRDEICLPMDEI
jgi:hypothetical protein